jgi:hypothetical protein
MRVSRLCGLMAVCAVTGAGTVFAGAAGAGNALTGARHLCEAQGGTFNGDTTEGLYKCTGPNGTFTPLEVSVAATFCVRAAGGSTLAVSSFGDFYTCIRFG